MIVSIGLSTPALHWAAEYAEANDSSYAKCFILVLVCQVMAVIISHIFAGGGFINNIIYSVINIVICMGVLKIPSENFFMFIIILIFINLIISWGGGLVLNGMLKAI